MKYLIIYSCGCGEEEEVIEASSQEEADACAYNAARENYESFEGLHGIRSMGDIAEEDFDVSLDEVDTESTLYADIEIAYNEEVESQISYEAHLMTDEEVREWEIDMGYRDEEEDEE